MIPVMAVRTATLTGNTADIELGFLPDWISVINTTNLGSIASADTLKVEGQPDKGSSSGKMLATQASVSASTATAILIDAGNKITHKKDTFYGINIASVSGFSASDQVIVMAYRENG